ncbi:hypothetical protein [Paraburkholderia hiiakae]|uniref:hypothetical protein n=1 Tax=Paraburkholderia hiiakae TaxID=1081782 RepID=UPI001918430A|nr:hypothetical protein [Paraburkholderia hiiakae]
MSDDLDPGAASGFSDPELCALSAFVDGELGGCCRALPGQPRNSCMKTGPARGLRFT